MLTEAGICVKQPEKWDQPVSALETGIYIGLAVILVLLIGSLTGYFIFRCVKYSQHVKSARPKVHGKEFQVLWNACESLQIAENEEGR